MDFASASTQDCELIRHELGLKNRFEDLETLSTWIAELLDHIKLSPRGTFRLELVLEEAVTNIVQYAYDEGDTEHDITIALSCQGKMIQVEIRDLGLPFNPLQRPEVVLPSNLEDAHEGGLGIHLIRNYADECHYQRESNQNILTIVICDADSSPVSEGK
jgi:anti-sigma regulatory factor (Ser/Thr protein kinase)